MNEHKDLKKRIDYLEIMIGKINTLNLDVLRRLNWQLSECTFKQSVIEFEDKNYKESGYFIGKSLKYFEISKE